jgi:hypothetical protein
LKPPFLIRCAGSLFAALQVLAVGFSDLRYFLPQLCNALFDGPRHGDSLTEDAAVAFFYKIRKIKLRQDDLQAIFSGRVDIFYLPNFGCFGRKGTFSTATPVFVNYPDSYPSLAFRCGLFPPARIRSQPREARPFRGH